MMRTIAGSGRAAPDSGRKASQGKVGHRLIATEDRIPAYPSTVMSGSPKVG